MEEESVSVQRSDHEAVAREIQAFIARYPNVFGGSDIYNLDSGVPIVRAGMVAAALTGLVDQEGRLAVRHFVVLVPPGTDRSGAVETVWAQFAASFEVLATRQLEPREVAALKARMNVLVCADRYHSSVLDIIAEQGERTAVIVTEAASYRDDEVESYVAPGAVTPLQPEDVWAPQLHALATGATRLAKEKALYVALDADELSPRRKELFDLLLTVDGCGVMGSDSAEDPETVLSKHVDQWDA